MKTYIAAALIVKGNTIIMALGIICVQGEKWKETRKFISNSLRLLGVVKFGPGRMKMQADVLEGVEDAVKEIGNSHLPIDPEDILLHSLGNVLFCLVFGRTWNKDDATWKTLQHLQAEGTKLIGVSAAINFLPFLRYFPKYIESMRFIEDGITFTHEIYQSFLSDYENKMKSPKAEPPPNLMAAFVNEMNTKGQLGHFNKTQFNYLMADIFGAGVDTTLATLRWFLLYMAINPKWQKLVQEELDLVDEGDGLVWDHLQRCPHLEACLLETQRIRPVTPVGIPHGTIKECQLGGYRIPAGSMIIPLQWAVHMNNQAYQQPELFNPYRFINDDGTIKRNDYFIPFQTGKRMCVGEEYARVLMFLFGGNIVLKFNISLPENTILNLSGEAGITLTPSHHLLKFDYRK